MSKMHKVVQKIQQLLKKYDCVQYRNSDNAGQRVAYEIWKNIVFYRSNESDANVYRLEADSDYWNHVKLSSIKPYTREHKQEGQKKGESNYDYICRLIKKGHIVSWMDGDEDLNVSIDLSSSGYIYCKYTDSDEYSNISYGGHETGSTDKFTDIKIHIEEDETEEETDIEDQVEEYLEENLEEKVKEVLKNL